MLQFTVEVEGITKENEGKWVLAVEGERVLIAGLEGELLWVEMSRCKFAGMVDPQLPQPMVLVDDVRSRGPRRQNPIIVPPNGMSPN